MKTRYSPVTGSFYPFDIDYGEDLPPDVIEVSQEDYHQAMSRPDGYLFKFADSQLVIEPPPPVPFSTLAAGYLMNVRATREAILNRLAGIGMAALLSGDTGLAVSIAQARQSLLDITSAPSVMDAMARESFVDLESNVQAIYKEIVLASPEALRKAFDKVSV
jgi:hypothetical protein